MDMHQINLETRINAPREKIWAILADFGGVDKWAPNVAHSASITAAKSGLGCERSCEIPQVGSLRERIIEWNEGKGYKYEIAAIPGTPVKSAYTTWSINEDGDQTIVMLASEFQLSGEEEVNTTFLEQTRTLLNTSLAALKQFVETGQKMILPSQAS